MRNYDTSRSGRPLGRRLTYLLAALAVFAALAWGLSENRAAAAAAGDLDTTFGTGGSGGVGFPGAAVPYALALQPDGKIVVVGEGAGDFAIARLNADGTADAGFGAAGRSTTHISGRSIARAVALQPDGKIVVAGQTESPSGDHTDDIAVVRYNPDGLPDTSFGNAGAVTTGVGFNERAYGVAVQADGRIVVVGERTGGPDDSFFAVARYNADGTPDSTFGAGGLRFTSFGGSSEAAYAVAVQPDQKLVVAGRGGRDSAGRSDFALARYNPDGTPDAAFDGDGRVLTDLGFGDFVTDVAVLPGGKIVASGSEEPASAGFGVARYNADGSPDVSFDADGRAVNSPEPGTSFAAEALVVQPDGKLIQAGTLLSNSSTAGNGIGLLRYRTDGTLDPTFDLDGRVAKGSGLIANLHDALMQPDGKLVIAGGNGVDFRVIRMQSLTSPPGTPTPTPMPLPPGADATFGDGGQTVLDFGLDSSSDTFATGVALQPDGKVVVSGYYSTFVPGVGSSSGKALARLNADGTLDQTFGAGGIVRPALVGGKVAIAVDGKILVAGGNSVARYNADGSPDSSFGAGGRVTTGGCDGNINNVVAQPDLKVVVVGGQCVGPAVHFRVTRYNADGTPDSSFGADGSVVTQVSNVDNKAVAAVLQPDGRLVSTGWSPAALVRYNADGALDSTFGDGGKVLPASGGNLFPASVALQPDGKVVVGGTIPSSTTYLYFVLRLNADGTPDASFGTNGLATAGIGRPGDYTEGGKVLLQPDGKIILVGGVRRAADFGTGPSAWLLMRFNADGSPDASFGTGGRIDFINASFTDGGDAVLQPDGKVIVVGGGFRGGKARAHVVRFNTAGTPTPTPTPTPSPTPTPVPRKIEFFTSGIYVEEGVNHFAPLTVVRTGDASGAASVDYTTRDVTATQKSDYTYTAGTLFFAPGETAKSIIVPLEDDSYPEPAESFAAVLSNPSPGTSLGAQSAVGVFFVPDTDSPTPGPNAIDDSSNFVRQHYHDFLGREPDTPGLAFWTGEIEGCGSNAQCREVKRVNVSAAFFLSIEFQETGFYAIRVQRVAFGRRSDDFRSRMSYGELVRDRGGIGNGLVVGAAGWEQLLDANKRAYASRVAGGGDFAARFPQAGAGEYVDALYASAGVAPTAAERQAAVDAFAAAGPVDAARAAALRTVADSQSVRTAELRAAFVLLQYQGYLRRNPTDAPDADDTGYQFWLGKLNAFGGNYVRAELVKAFITSDEYRRRFGQP